jgi:hypothetical protein
MNIVNPITVAAALTASSLGSGILVTPAGITFEGDSSEELGEFGGAFNDESNIINGSGLSGIPDISNYTTITHSNPTFTPPGIAWATIGDPGTDFFAAGGIAPILTIDLGSTFNLVGMVSWGYNFFGANHANFMKTSTLEFSSDGGATYHTTTGVTTPFPGTFNLASSTSFPQVSANFVRLTVTDNHFDGITDGGDRVGISELRFLAVPEPSTSLLGALASLALLRRRR